MRFSIINLALLAASAVATPYTKPNSTVPEETRTLDEIHKAALREGGVVTVWHGGDEANRQDALKKAFEARFPGMTLNITVDLSKYLDGNLDQQLADKHVFVDSIILQTLHDYPRWKKQGALLNYAPAGFSNIYPPFKDADAAYTGLFVTAWGMTVNVNKTNATVHEYTDFLKPAFKDKLALTYPNDDDAVLYQFHLNVQKYGVQWLDNLVAQNPRWVRGTATPRTLLDAANSTTVASFTSWYRPTNDSGTAIPQQGQFVSWPQTGAILKHAPHPEGAKLLHNYMLSREQQISRGWSVRQDVAPPAGYSKIWEQKGTNATGFGAWMMDRAEVERVRFWFESRLGTPQGKSPLIDGL